jgi:hypothetical protein
VRRSVVPEAVTARLTTVVAALGSPLGSHRYWNYATLLIATAIVSPWLLAFVTYPQGVLGLVGADFHIYRDAAHSLFAGGPWYLDRQLHGPYSIEYGDILYPPVIAWLLGNFVPLPTALWWFVPTVTIVSALVANLPRPWARALILLCLVPPLTFEQLLKGNPVIWLMAGEAIALARGWGMAFILLKPSLFPFALIGFRKLSWWVSLAALFVASIPFLSDTLLYPQVILDSRGGGLLYSIRDVPLLLIPILIWVGGRRRAEAQGVAGAADAEGGATFIR